MRIDITGFFVPKSEEKMSSCEDSLAVNTVNKSFAISDGVTQSLYSGIFSNILTQEYVKGPSAFFVNDGVQKPKASVCKEYDMQFQRVFDSLPPNKQGLVKISKKRCGFGAATFVGLRIVGDDFKIDTLGDSVVFYCDKQGNVTHYCSMSDNGVLKFDNSPEYVTSDGQIHGKFLSSTFPVREGVVFMMTDALSAWFNNSADKGSVINTLLSFKTHDEFQSFVDKTRRNGLKDDDTTMIALNVVEDGKPFVSLNEIHIDKMSDFEDKKPPLVVNAEKKPPVSEKPPVVKPPVVVKPPEKVENKTKGVEVEQVQTKKPLESVVDDLSNEMKTLKSQLQNLPITILQKVDGKLRELTELIKNTKPTTTIVENKFDPAPLNAEIRQIKSKIATLNAVGNSQPGQSVQVVENPFDSKPLEERLSKLEASIGKMSKDSSSVVDIEEIRDELANLKHKISIVNANIDNDALKNEITELQSQIAELREKVKTLEEHKSKFDKDIENWRKFQNLSFLGKIRFIISGEF